MNQGIYTKEDLFERNITLDAAYEIIKNLDETKDINEQIKHIPFLLKVYKVDSTKILFRKSHIGWLLSPYHFVYEDDPAKILFTYAMYFKRDSDNDVILEEIICKQPLYNTWFNVSICDAPSHDLIEFRVEHWLHKEGLDGFPLHVFMSCDCGLSHCQYDDREFYYNESEDFYLHELSDEKPLVKVYVYVYIRDKL
jgi:hypothetical protein